MYLPLQIQLVLLALDEMTQTMLLGMYPSPISMLQ